MLSVLVNLGGFASSRGFGIFPRTKNAHLLNLIILALKKHNPALRIKDPLPCLHILGIHNISPLFTLSLSSLLKKLN